MTRFVLLLALLTVPGMTVAASSREFCGSLPELLNHLRNTYKEWVVMTADAATHRVYLTASDEGTWSLLRAEGGHACIVGAGRNAEWMKAL